MSDVVESRVREVLARQAALLEPPARSIDDLSAVTLLHEPESPRRSARLLVGAATVAAVVGAVLVVSRSGDDPEVVQPLDGTTTAPVSLPPTEDPSDEPGASRDLRLVTPQVSLEATDITVTIGDRVFRPAGKPFSSPVEEGQVDVHSDAGDADYTTLELTWYEHGVEMRIFMYFASDGTDWWATEIRTYDGNERGEWIYATGEFFRTPLGATYEGDFEQGPLRMEGMHLRAFLDPVPVGADGPSPVGADAEPPATSEDS